LDGCMACGFRLVQSIAVVDRLVAACTSLGCCDGVGGTYLGVGNHASTKQTL
jgi:hypothetical protein